MASAESIAAVEEAKAAGNRLLATMNDATSALRAVANLKPRSLAETNALVTAVALFDARLKEAVEAHVAMRYAAGRAALLAAAEEPGRSEKNAAALHVAADEFAGRQIVGLATLSPTKGWTVGRRMNETKRVMAHNGAVFDKALAAAMKRGQDVVAVVTAGSGATALGALGGNFISRTAKKVGGAIKDVVDDAAGFVRNVGRQLDPTNGNLWDSMAKIPGILVSYNPFTLPIVVAGEIGEQFGIKPLKWVDDKFDDAANWTMDHPIETTILAAAAIGTVATAGALAAPAGTAGGLFATAGAAGLVGSTVKTADAFANSPQVAGPPPSNGPPPGSSPQSQVPPAVTNVTNVTIVAPDGSTPPGSTPPGGGPPPPPPGTSTPEYDAAHGGPPTVAPDGTTVWPDGSAIRPDGTVLPPGSTRLDLTTGEARTNVVTASSGPILSMLGLAALGAVVFYASKSKDREAEGV